MTSAELRREIAVFCGWKCIPVPVKAYSDWCEDSHLPNYTQDLNAMWEAEEKLIQSITLDEWQHYVSYLVELCGNAKRPAYVVTALDHVTFAVHATAKQRAIAFVKTILHP